MERILAADEAIKTGKLGDREAHGRPARRAPDLGSDARRRATTCLGTSSVAMASRRITHVSPIRPLLLSHPEMVRQDVGGWHNPQRRFAEADGRSRHHRPAKTSYSHNTCPGAGQTSPDSAARRPGSCSSSPRCGSLSNQSKPTCMVTSFGRPSGRTRLRRRPSGTERGAAKPAARSAAPRRGAPGRVRASRGAGEPATPPYRC